MDPSKGARAVSMLSIIAALTTGAPVRMRRDVVREEFPARMPLITPHQESVGAALYVATGTSIDARS